MIPIGDDKHTRDFPLVNMSLIGATVCCFVWQFAQALEYSTTHGMVPSRFLLNMGPFELGTLVSSMFLHAGPIHLISNMWFLFIFGDNVEEHFGHVNYLLFYLTCGIIGGLTYISFNADSSIPAIGASGAIAGVLGAYWLLYPDARVKTWWGDDSLFFAFRTYQVPAFIFIGVWFLFQYVGIYFQIPGIGWHDHIGGFLTGISIVILYRLCGAAKEDYGGVCPPEIAAGASRTRATISCLLIAALVGLSSMFLIDQMSANQAEASTSTVKRSDLGKNTKRHKKQVRTKRIKRKKRKNRLAVSEGV